MGTWAHGNWYHTILLLQTTSLAVSWCLHALSQNNEVQEKARQEILSVLSESDDISFEDMERMEYVAAVCKEALRQES